MACCQRMGEQGLSPNSAGVVSGVDEGLLWITPDELPLAAVTPLHLTVRWTASTKQPAVFDNATGSSECSAPQQTTDTIEPPLITSQTHPVSSQIQLHTAIYQQNPNIRGIIYAQPPYLTALATLYTSLSESQQIELQKHVPSIYLTDVQLQSEDLLDLRTWQPNQRHIVVRWNHSPGVFVVGNSIEAAQQTLHALEAEAQWAFLVRQLATAWV